MEERAKLGWDLRGKTALVTGGNQGIGWAVAELLSHAGADVIVNYPSAERYPTSLERLRNASAIEADLSSVSNIARMFDTLEQRLPSLNILVNNAGIFPRRGFLEMSETEWDAVLAVNLRSYFFCSQRAARWMIRVGSGNIVNVASDAAFVGNPMGAHYCASKAGVISLTKSFALGLASYGIRVNAVAPGMTETAQTWDWLTPEQVIESQARIPLGKMASPTTIAKAVLYLATDAAEHITGATLLVNGGSTMVP